jgi:phosphonate C-P lyase system protein PhnH
MNVIVVDPLWRAETQQEVFKKLLLAMSYVGRPQVLPEGIDRETAAVAVLAALVDEACTYSDPHDVVTPTQAGFLGSPKVGPAEADYVIAEGKSIPDLKVRNGTIYRPEASATVLLSIGEENGNHKWRLRGPGIEDSELLRGNESLGAWLAWRDDLVAYPLGIDLILCFGKSVVAIPRTTVIRRAVEEE